MMTKLGLGGQKIYVSSCWIQKLLNTSLMKLTTICPQKISVDINQASATLDLLNKMIKYYRDVQVVHTDVTVNEIANFEEIRNCLCLLHQKWCTIFTWQDGPLIEAMKNGDMFLVDEISLADDSYLAEKGGSDLEKITAHPNFFILATMNPGGDYGKKELSPALRNRFTEIWVPPVNELMELKSIAVEKISNQEISFVVDAMINFWEWFNRLQTGRLLTESKLRLNQTDILTAENYDWYDILKSAEILSSNDMEIDTQFGIHPFYIEKGGNHLETKRFDFVAPTTRRNSLPVLRAMQLKKPVLLEGSPGVGKTSLVLAHGKFSGHSVVRINLSEQTDMMDLLGSDLAVESDEGMQFYIYIYFEYKKIF
ncbi:hypothetical protein LXL04_023562 [Taraxacum kok-saghyz]